MPGMFKNTIAWLSRPPADIGWVFGGKPVAVLGASPGVIGTVLPRYTHPLHQNPPEHGPDDGSTARTASSPRRDVRGYSPPQAGVCTDIQLARWRCSLIQTSLHLLSRRSAMVYGPTGQHLTKSFVKETSMSSLYIACGGGIPSVSVAGVSKASRSASTALICPSSNSSRSSSRPI